MTVKQLIKILESFEQDKTVFAQCIHISDNEEPIDSKGVREYPDVVIVGSY